MVITYWQFPGDILKIFITAMTSVSATFILYVLFFLFFFTSKLIYVYFRSAESSIHSHWRRSLASSSQLRQRRAASATAAASSAGSPRAPAPAAGQVLPVTWSRWQQCHPRWDKQCSSCTFFFTKALSFRILDVNEEITDQHHQRKLLVPSNINFKYLNYKCSYKP